MEDFGDFDNTEVYTGSELSDFVKMGLARLLDLKSNSVSNGSCLEKSAKGSVLSNGSSPNGSVGKTFDDPFNDMLFKLIIF